jgi:predicted nuclease of predicted toxin-antitoxin system
MKFLIDAQLPKALARFFRERGFDAIHTLELPDKNITGDLEINRISLTEQRIVISKDSDFYNSYSAKQEPYKLLYLTTGNIRNRDLIELFDKNLPLIIRVLQNGSVVEINQTAVIVIH